MHNQNNTPTNMFFLALFAGKAVELYNGVETADGHFGRAIILPTIPGMSKGKSIVCPDKFKPAEVSRNGKIYNALFQLNGGDKKFADPRTFATLVKPEAGNTKIVIVSKKRWDFENKLPAEISIKCERGTGNPNGSVAPGTMILNDGDSIKFVWEGRNYTITNFEGYANLVVEKPAPVKKEVKVKTPAPEVIADNRVKIEDNLTVVGKVDLEPKKVEKTVEAPVAAIKAPEKPAAKKPEKKKFFKKNHGDNGNHFVAADVAVPEFVPATEGLASVAGADKLTAMLVEMEKGTGKKGSRKPKKATA